MWGYTFCLMEIYRYLSKTIGHFDGGCAHMWVRVWNNIIVTWCMYNKFRKHIICTLCCWVNWIFFSHQTLPNYINAFYFLAFLQRWNIKSDTNVSAHTDRISNNSAWNNCIQKKNELSSTFLPHISIRCIVLQSPESIHIHLPLILTQQKTKAKMYNIYELQIRLQLDVHPIPMLWIWIDIHIITSKKWATLTHALQHLMTIEWTCQMWRSYWKNSHDSRTRDFFVSFSSFGEHMRIVSQLRILSVWFRHHSQTQTKTRFHLLLLLNIAFLKYNRND